VSITVIVQVPFALVPSKILKEPPCGFQDPLNGALAIVISPPKLIKQQFV
jgi:hypothetical protein